MEFVNRSRGLTSSFNEIFPQKSFLRCLYTKRIVDPILTHII